MPDDIYLLFMFLTSFADTVYYHAGVENYAHRGYH
jgi:hypothetical protein